MKRKLLFFDLDGTLLPEGHGAITPSAVAAMEQARENGHLCFVNTGRPMGSVGDNVRSFPFDGYICGCGTHIIYEDQTLSHVEIPAEILYELVKWNERERIDIFFEGEEGLIFPPNAEFKDLDLMEYYFKLQGADVRYYDYDISSPEDINFRVDKFSMWFDPEEPPVEFRSYLEQYFSIIERHDDFWEVIPKGYSKASGIRDLVRSLGADMTDTISFGDSYNDVTMFSCTKDSVLVGSRFPDLKDQVTYVTAELEEDGVAKALAHFGLL